MKRILVTVNYVVTVPDDMKDDQIARVARTRLFMLVDTVLLKYEVVASSPDKEKGARR